MSLFLRSLASKGSSERRVLGLMESFIKRLKKRETGKVPHRRMQQGVHGRAEGWLVCGWEGRRKHR